MFLIIFHITSQAKGDIDTPVAYWERDGTCIYDCHDHALKIYQY